MKKGVMAQICASRDEGALRRTFIWRWRIFGFYLYVSNRRMKLRQKRDELEGKHRKRLRRMKHVLYGMTGGRCQECGKEFAEGALQIHHIVPISEDPSLAVSMSNLMVVCPDCHRRLHRLGWPAGKPPATLAAGGDGGAAGADG